MTGSSNTSTSSHRAVEPILAVVQALVNTRGILAGNPYAREELDSPAALGTWLAAHTPTGADLPAAGPSDLSAALVLREGLRGLLAANNRCAGREERESIAALEALTCDLPLRATTTGDDITLVAVEAGTPRAALAGLLAQVVRARFGGSWSRLKACQDPDCREAFVDWSRNRSRVWCSMEVCGARAKQRTFAARHR